MVLLSAGFDRHFATCPFTDVDKLAIPPCDLVNCGFARSPVCQSFDNSLREVRAPDREADDPRYCGRGCQPFTHLLVVLSAPQNDTTYFVTASVTSRRHDTLAILAAIQTFYFPDVGLYVCILKFLNRLNHEPRPDLHVVR